MPTETAKNFSGQDLRGRSFQGQNLARANFSGADLRGANFRDAILTHADFSRALCGKTSGAALGNFLLISFISFWVGAFVGGGEVGLVNMVLRFLSPVRGLQEGQVFFWAISALVIIHTVIVYIIQRNGLVGLIPVGIIMALSMGVGVVAVAGTMAIAGVLAMVGALAVIVALAMAVVGALVGAFVVSGGGLGGLIIGGSAWVAAVTVLFSSSLYIAWRVRKDDPQWAALRQFGSALSGLGGTDFRGADLSYARFCEADLKHAHLSSANLHHANFRLAKNLKNARVADTLLELPAVRELLVTGAANYGVYAGLNLKGAFLRAAKLAQADFHEADLSGADLRETDLSRANLSKTQLIGADLRGATLTGACIEAWNIDSSTRLTNIVCEWVVLDGAKHVGQPPRGTFKSGEVAHTLDFVVENRTELAALQRAIKTLHEQGTDGLEIQSVERAGNDYKVRVSASAEINREQIFEQMKREHEG